MLLLPPTVTSHSTRSLEQVGAIVDGRISKHIGVCDANKPYNILRLSVDNVNYYIRSRPVLIES